MLFTLYVGVEHLRYFLLNNEQLVLLIRRIEQDRRAKAQFL